MTQEQELDKYLQEKKADMLMICEGAYEYDATRTGNKTVVLCEEEIRMPMKSILKRREGW